jgi:hypothetical protein
LALVIVLAVEVEAAVMVAVWLVLTPVGAMEDWLLFLL